MSLLLVVGTISPFRRFHCDTAEEKCHQFQWGALIAETSASASHSHQMFPPVWHWARTVARAVLNYNFRCGVGVFFLSGFWSSSVEPFITFRLCFTVYRQDAQFWEPDGILLHDCTSYNYGKTIEGICKSDDLIDFHNDHLFKRCNEFSWHKCVTCG